MSKLCGDPECHVSSDMGGNATFGKGELDNYGYWKIPCGTCARKWEELYSDKEAWPFRDDSPIRLALERIGLVTQRIVH